MSRSDLISKVATGDHFLQTEGQAEAKFGGRRGCGRRSVLCAVDMELRTLDLDTTFSHCPLLSPFYQAPAVHGLTAQASASQLPGQQSHHSTGWHRVRHRGAPGSLAEVQPGATPDPPISTDHCWGRTGLDPPCCTASQGCRRGYINSYLESHKQRVGLSANLASVDSSTSHNPLN